MGLVGFESAPRYRELLYKLISEDLEFPPAGFILESDRPEWSFLKDEIRWSVQPTLVAAVAAQFSFMHLRSPLTSTRVVVITDYWAKDSGVGVRDVRGAIGNTPRGVTGAAFAAAVDLRWNTPTTATLVAREPVIVETGATAAFGTDTEVYEGKTRLVNVWERLPFPVTILAPGTAFNLSNNTLNEAMSFWMAGYARAARPEELVP